MKRTNGSIAVALVAVVAVVAVATLSSAGRAHADARADKVELYIEVHNMFSTRMHANHDRYVPSLQGLDPENPCTVDRQPGHDLYNTANSVGTIDGFRRRLRRAPRLPQDLLVTAMLDAAAIEIPAYNAAYDYYHRRVFTTDQCVQGNVYHRQLMAAFASFFAADAELLQFLDGETRTQRAAASSAVEREHGRNFRFFQLSIVAEIENVRDVLGAASHDVAALERALQSIAALTAEIAPRAEASPQEIHADLYQGQYLTFLNRVGTLVSTGNAFVAALHSAGSAGDRERRMTEFERAFTEAIQASNSVRFSDRVH